MGNQLKKKERHALLTNTNDSSEAARAARVVRVRKENRQYVHIPARLLHDLGPVVAADLAEGLIAVDDREIDDLCVGQKERAVRCKGEKKHNKLNLIGYYLTINIQ